VAHGPQIRQRVVASPGLGEPVIDHEGSLAAYTAAVVVPDHDPPPGPSPAGGLGVGGGRPPGDSNHRVILAGTDVGAPGNTAQLGSLSHQNVTSDRERRVRGMPAAIQSPVASQASTAAIAPSIFNGESGRSLRMTHSGLSSSSVMVSVCFIAADTCEPN